MKRLSPGEKNILSKVLKHAGKTINRHSMIHADDTLVVGVSGGKDSLSLLDILVRRQKHLPVSYRLIPVFVRMKGVHDSFDSTSLKEFCIDTAGSYQEIETACDLTTGKDPCFICSWHRRKALFNFCREEGYTRIALGHTMDDRAETLLMNLFYQGNISSMPLKLELFKGNLTLIRPLGELPEEEIIDYSQILKLPVDKSSCSYFNDQARREVRDLLAGLENTHPHVRQSITSALDNIKEEYI